jgi:hypothetical protein
MNEQPRNLDQMLPFGEQLRTLMVQSYVSPGDLNSILKSRGIFLRNTDKKDTIPVLSNVLLSPVEFEQLCDCQNIREDNPKLITQTIAFSSDEPLIDCIPETFNINDYLDLDFAQYKVKGEPKFIPVGEDLDHVKMDFQIERSDLSKSWASEKKVFSGSLELKKSESGENIQVLMTHRHTSQETKVISTKVSRVLVQKFKENGYVEEQENLEKITFSSFSNENRVAYLLAITKNLDSPMLDFLSVVDLGISPDPKVELSQDLKWIQSEIEKMKLNGENLHKTFFISRKDNHKCVEIYQLDARFKMLDIKGVSGECVISFVFRDFLKSQDRESELEVDVTRISPVAPLKGITQNELRSFILKEIEEKKITLFEKYKNSQ